MFFPDTSLVPKGANLGCTENLFQLRFPFGTCPELGRTPTWCRTFAVSSCCKSLAQVVWKNEGLCSMASQTTAALSGKWPPCVTIFSLVFQTASSKPFWFLKIESILFSATSAILDWNNVCNAGRSLVLAVLFVEVIQTGMLLVRLLPATREVLMENIPSMRSWNEIENNLLTALTIRTYKRSYV